MASTGLGCPWNFYAESGKVVAGDFGYKEGSNSKPRPDVVFSKDERPSGGNDKINTEQNRFPLISQASLLEACLRIRSYSTRRVPPGSCCPGELNPWRS